MMDDDARKALTDYRDVRGLVLARCAGAGRGTTALAVAGDQSTLFAACRA